MLCCQNFFTKKATKLNIVLPRTIPTKKATQLDIVLTKKTFPSIKAIKPMHVGDVGW